ncbi:trichohyalin isoform X1 [Uranotaenia lowii]|uniref:trichohyalin isoform X1 n=1 Tax=Uranotaenia lowii TaxID=190385 RepID=UPI00247864C4|nr:trichohyalin isoform X1 [Uranotaenia lowii]XP_055611431.1 trichohyalin isoform X1 [Uranotaenia lowii]XP_055611432.1 trichohyalin isoform X1 [Uranotaenia lowii]
MSTQDVRGRPSTLLQRYQPKGGSQNPLQQPMDNRPISRSTSQRSLQNSTLLQKYYNKAPSQDLQSENIPPQPDQSRQMPTKSSSQRSLDQSKFLQRYQKQHSQDSQDVPKPDPQRFSSQKSLESSKLLQRYNPVNNSQEFSGLAARESTPVARFARSGSLDHDRLARPSLLSKYTPRFNQSLNRHKTMGVSGYSNYSSQQSLEQSEPQQSTGDYSSDHFDQYSAANIRSRSSSMAKGLSRRSAQRDLEPSSQTMEMEVDQTPLEPVTPETLPVVVASEPVMGNIASALPMPMPMLGLIPPTPTVEMNLPSAPEPIPAVQTVQPEPEKPKRKEPQKPPRKDLASSTTVSIPTIPTIKTTITVDPPKPIITSKKAAPVVPKEPSPPLFSNRDHMEHYGSASVPNPLTPDQTPAHLRSPLTPRPAAPATQAKKDTLLLPISDFSSRRSMTDLRNSTELEPNPFDMDIDEFSDRRELRSFTKKKDPVKSTLASAFEQIAVLSVPQAMTNIENNDDAIEAMPPDRKLKKRDHTYHPSFTPKQTKQEENEKKKLEEKEKRDALKAEQDRKKEEERLKKEDEKLKKEQDKLKKEEEKHRREEEKLRAIDEKRRKDEEGKHIKEEQKRLKTEEDKRRKEEEKLLKEEEKRMKEEEKRIKEEEKRKKDEEKKRQKAEKKKGAASKSQADEQEQEAAEEEPIDFGSHFEQYNAPSSQPVRSSSIGRPRSGGTPRGSIGALNRNTLPTSASQMYSSQQSLDRNTGVQSKMLQRYAKRSGSQDMTHSEEARQFIRDVHRSQGSLDQQRVSRSTLLQKYTPKPLSASMGNSQPAPVTANESAPKSTSQISLDKNRMEKSALLQKYKPRNETVSITITDTSTLEGEEANQRMASVAFQAKKRTSKSNTFDYRDHEYEPVGEPIEKDAATQGAAAGLAPPGNNQQRKPSNASLRATGEEVDTVSMAELQRDIEDHLFTRQSEEEAAEAVETGPEKTSKMKAVMTRAQESGKKAMAMAQESSKMAMSRAQEGGKSLHQKLRKQTDKFKTKMSTINVKKDKDAAPLASPEIVTTPEIEKLDFTIAEPKEENETEQTEPTEPTSDNAEAATQQPSAEGNGTAKRRFKTAEFAKLKNIHMPKLQKPEFKRPDFSKMSLGKGTKIKRPEIPKFLTEKPDFSKLKMPQKIGAIKLQRSKSMKESSPLANASAASPSDLETPSVMGEDGTKKKINYTDFSTYPRFLDKFKRQKSAPGNASVKAATPPPLEFTKTTRTTRPKGPSFISRWAEKSSEDTGSNRFFSGSEMGEREGSVERRMRQRLEQADFDIPELPVTAEQKQLEEYDKENREIHLLSAARHDEFLKRKPPMERQESDLASEEEKQFWASSLGQKIRHNIDMNSNDFDFLDEEDRLRTARENETLGLSERDRARFLGENTEQSERDYDMRSTTPYSNKECQSSGGSSGIRRRKGVLEEIDDDEFFLRQKGISKDNIQMGEYISTAIKEGLSTPKNALAEMGRYDSYYDEDMDASERMSASGLRYYQPSFESDDVSNKQSFTDEFQRNAEFFKTFPPDRPSRKHKKSYNEEHDDDQQKVPYESRQQDDPDVAFYHSDRKYNDDKLQTPFEKEQQYIDDESAGNGFTRTGTAVPPTPPRRRKKRFRDVTPSVLEPFGEGLTTKPIYNSFTIGPETHLYRADVPLAQEESFTTPLPTPRRSLSRSQMSKTFDDDRTSRGAESFIFGADDNALVKNSLDMSESNGYATVRKEPPPRPPAPIRRRRSTRSLTDQRQFNTLPNFHSVSPMRPSRNYSTISPNRPPRGRSISSLNDNQLNTTIISKEDLTQYEYIEDTENNAKVHQTLQSGAIVNKMKDRPLPPPPRPPREHKKPRKPEPDDDRYDFDGGAERISSFGAIEPRTVEEVEIAIQTDPVSEDFELDAEVSETIGIADEAEKPLKTLQDILREEQQAEIDRARQLAEANNLMRDIQKFRDSTSSLSLQGSRPETPSGILLERRVSTPSFNGRSNNILLRPLSIEDLTEADLANAEDDKYIAELVNKYVSEEKVPEVKRAVNKVEADSGEKMEQSRLQQIESMIVQDNVVRVEAPIVRSDPTAPPRRRSLVASNTDLPRSVEIPSNVIEEIVERLRTNEQQHIAELHQLHLQQLEDLKKQQEEQKHLQEQKLEEQQRQVLEQQNQQLHETQQLKEQILLQQEQQKALLQQQQQQQQQLLIAQQQQQILLQQQEKERELQRERERELLREREIELEKARERERELHHARELELQRARELEQQRAKELEQQRLREMELQRAIEIEHQRLRELELQRAQEAEMQRAREAELMRAREAELQRAREMELQRARDAELHRIREAELLKSKELELLKIQEAKQDIQRERTTDPAAQEETVDAVLKETVDAVLKLKEVTEEIAVEITEASEAVQEPSKTGTIPKEPVKETAPARPPPPRISPQISPDATAYPEYVPYTLPPQPYYPVRNFSDDEAAFPQAPQRRRRHHRSRRDSTSEEEFQREQRKQRHGTRSPEPSIPSLSGQLIRACGSSIMQTGDDLMTILRASSKDENKRDLHIALIILIVIVAGLMALGMSGEKSVHHHHWDYFNPPGNAK